MKKRVVKEAYVARDKQVRRYMRLARFLSIAAAGLLAGAAQAGVWQPIPPIDFTNDAAAATNSRTIREQSIYNDVHRKADLPTGGEFVRHPKKQSVQYYFTNRNRTSGDATNVRKLPGLYVSEDFGETWKLLCYVFEFQELFVHPETSTLYAVIHYTWLAKNEDGYLWSHTANKALLSEDGKHWTDITGGSGYIADITGVVTDPDNPRRVCLRVNVIRDCMLQSVDDKYSSWTWYKASDWPNREEIRKMPQQRFTNGFGG